MPRAVMRLQRFVLHALAASERDGSRSSAYEQPALSRSHIAPVFKRSRWQAHASHGRASWRVTEAGAAGMALNLVDGSWRHGTMQRDAVRCCA